MKMYDEDTTVVKFGKMSERVMVTSGIMQGYSAYTFFLKLVTLKIIWDLRDKDDTNRCGNRYLNSL